MGDARRTGDEDELSAAEREREEAIAEGRDVDERDLRMNRETEFDSFEGSMEG